MRPVGSSSLRYAAVITALFAAFPAAAQTSSFEFSFAPPPITDVVAPGKEASRLNFTYLEVDVPNNPFRGMGLDFVNRRAGPENLGFAWSLRGMGLSDEKGTTSGGMFGGTIGPELYLGDGRNTILFGGVSFDFMAFTVSMAGGDAQTTGVSAGLNVGLQHHFKLGERTTLIPYVVAGTTSSSFTTTVDTAFGTFSSETTASYSTTTVGFDLTVSEISIGALAATGGNNDVTMLRLGFAF